ncbi:hypothetical protein CLORY_36650 [Clostridium oryzae]|uniref:Uncharacterized protein n=1 Tax=Clostridium oryzae TaxID=1450648 RepID=A0A1V4IE79_9CLOT|nr:hypothetical protein CLORY_36650 [Clostridium oryzae]
MIFTLPKRKKALYSLPLKHIIGGKEYGEKIKFKLVYIQQ